MTANIYFISDGTNYYISLDGAKRTYYSGSGTPWTTQSTTPYDLAMNDTTGQRWTPQNSPRSEVYGGGPPFHDGQQLIYTSYNTVNETIPLQIYATSHDNAVSLLRRLRQILNTALSTTPCLLAVQPDGATSVSYFEIYGADVQESAAFINDESQPFQSPQSKGVLRTMITLRRSPVGGRLSTGESLISAATFTNTGTGANNNTQAYSTGGGDLINEGSPLNVKWKAASTSNDIVYLASVLERKYSTTNAGAYNTVATTDTGVLQFTSAITLTNQPYANAPIKGRVLMRFSAINSLTRIRIVVYPNGADGSPIYSSPWVQPLVAGSATLVDMGAFDMTPLRLTDYNSNKIQIVLYHKSTTGGSATFTFTYMEVLPYYTFGYAKMSHVLAAGDELRVRTMNERSNAPVVPRPTTVGSSTGGTDLSMIHYFRGAPPRYYAGASLYVAWLASDFSHSTTDTATVTVTHATAFKTLRGAG